MMISKDDFVSLKDGDVVETGLGKATVDVEPTVRVIHDPALNKGADSLPRHLIVSLVSKAP